MATVVETFDPTEISNASVQFIDDDGTQQPGTPFKCLGQVEGETTLKELVKKCAGREVNKRVKPEKMSLKVNAHVPVAIVRDLFGLSNTDLKTGVYKYSTSAHGKNFVLTADVIDEFEDVTKLVSFPKCVSATGLVFTIENGADEVAEMELEFDAYPDAQGNLMYEAFVSELDAVDADTITSTWHTQFDYTLVEAAAV